jgi:hypothetical protein
LTLISCDAQAELVQTRCGYSYGGFMIELGYPSKAGEPVKARYFVAFNADGPGFYLPGGDQYVPYWKEIEGMVFVSARDRGTGHLSFMLRQHGFASVQRVGLIKRDCWDLAKEWLARNQPQVPIVESVEPQK